MKITIIAFIIVLLIILQRAKLIDFEIKYTLVFALLLIILTF